MFWGLTICRETYGNGALTNMIRILHQMTALIQRRELLSIRKVPCLEPNVLFAATAGETKKNTVLSVIEVCTPQTKMMPAASASVWRKSSNNAKI